MGIKHSLKVGLSFGLTSAIITTLGLMIGLTSGTHSKLAVIAGILTIAFCDAFSDALGIHLSEESETKHSKKEIWESTFSTFFFKLIFGLSFLPAILLLELSKAIILNIIWGLFLLSLLSYFLAKEENEKWYKVVFEHLFLAILVIFLSNFIGSLISSFFS